MRARCVVFGLFGFSVLGQQPAWAEPKIFDAALAQQAERERQRELFRKAEYAAKRGQTQTYQRLLTQLGDYPLLPYLELERLQRVGYLANEERVLAFMQTYDQSPLDWQLRDQWLQYLAEKGEAQRYLRDFRHPGSFSERCHYYRFALQEQSMPTEAIWRAVDAIWQHGESLPSACDPLFKQWAEAGQRTTDKIWQRASNAAQEGQHTLLPYLASLVDDDLATRIEQYRSVRRNPANVERVLETLGAKQAHLDKAAEIVTYALGRYIWRDAPRALNTHADLPKWLVFTEAQQQFLRQRFAVALAVQNRPEADQWLAQLQAQDHNEQTLQWLLAHWVREGAWQDLIAFTEQQTELIGEQVAWQYWRARAYAETGAVVMSDQLMRSIADQRNYYGFMAASRSDQPLALQRELLDVADEALDQLRQQPAVQRTYELLQLGRYVDARREWYTLLQHSDTTQQQQLAALADQWGWHDQAIYTVGQLGQFGALNVRFPQAYLDTHKQFSAQVGIEVEWSLAISRRESAFRFDAYSPAGAMGLMQLLPSTAKYIDRRDYSRFELQNVSTNIRLGTRYLADLKRRLGDNWVLATTAYNGGIYRVLEWLPEEPMAIDRWIETIPYKETRDYVKNVLAYKQIYLVLRANQDNKPPVNVFNQLVPMTISAQL